MLKRLPIILGIVQLTVAFGAIPSGLSLIIDTSGSGIGLSTDVLLNSPFETFLFPGLFLFIVNGLANAIGAVLSFARNQYAGMAGLVLGIILMLWISIQVYFLGLSHYLQTIFFIIGIMEGTLAYYLIIKTKPK